MERTKIKFGAGHVDVTQVEILQRSESQFEYELEDGAKIRVNNAAGVVYRMDEVDDQGNPIYIIKNGTSVVVVRGPNRAD